MSGRLTVEQQFLVGPGETQISELEKVVEVIAGKFADPGFMKPASQRVANVVAYLDAHDGADYRLLEKLESEMELLRDLVAFKPGDLGKPYPTHERVVSVIAELEKRLASATATLEAIAHAEGFS